MLARGDHNRFTGRVLERPRKFERSAPSAGERSTANAAAGNSATAPIATCAAARAPAGASTCTCTCTTATCTSARTPAGAAADLNQFGIGRLLAGKRH